MTVSYSASIATSSHWAFLRLLLRWKGSVYKVIWFEFALFSCLYTIISLIYRLALSGNIKRDFEYFCQRCYFLAELIPVGFVLAFYVNTIVKRWWQQFCVIPWPDSLALYISAYAKGTSERAIMQKRTFLRYVNLSFCLMTRDISSRARLRFPTLDHLVSAGLITQDELELFKTCPSEGLAPLAVIPLTWAQALVNEMYIEKNIVFDRAVELLTIEIASFRKGLTDLFAYDWINVPLVYTQVSTLTVYAYFLMCLFAWQYLEPSDKDKAVHMDLYVPIFGLLRLIFYAGWLKVAETLINPFGEDADDFEIEEYIERNLQFCYFWHESSHKKPPPLVKDAFMDSDDINLPQTISLEQSDLARKESVLSNESFFFGSLAHTDFSNMRKMSTYG